MHQLAISSASPLYLPYISQEMHQLAISSASPLYLPYISQEMHQLAVLPTELVGTYSCHGIDSNQDKINQDAACICYPLTGDPHSAALIVVDGHGELGHDVTDEVLQG